MTRALLAGSYASVRMPGGARFGEVTLQSTLITPGAVTSALNDVKQHATHLNLDIIADGSLITGHEGGQRFKSDWQSFVRRFDVWNAQTTGLYGSVAYIAGQVVADLRRYAGEYNELEGRYTQITGHDPSYNPHPQGDQFLPTEAWVGIGLGTFVLLAGFAAWGLSSYARVAAPVARARAAAM